MNKDSRIYVAGGSGLVGSAIVRELISKGYYDIFTGVGTFDLRKKDHVDFVFKHHRPEYVFLAAAHAGGIKEAIDHPVEMLSDNLLIQTNVINACHQFGVKKLIFLGSSCLYPVDGKQPYTEEQIGTGKTDENWSYAVAKLAGIELCRAYHRQYGCNFMTVMPCNLYGINDRFDEYGHVVPSLIQKIDNEKSIRVKLWGDGRAKREFLYSDDLAEACVMLMESYNYNDLTDGVINIGSGNQVSILKLYDIISDAIGKYRTMSPVMEKDKPSGVHSKLMDSSRIRAFGWEPKTSLADGIEKVYEWFKNRRGVI